MDLHCVPELWLGLSLTAPEDGQSLRSKRPDLLYSDPVGADKRSPPLTVVPVCLVLSLNSQQSALSGQLNAALLPVRRD